MSFREKSAWVMLCIMVLSGAYYGWASAAIPSEAPPEMQRAALAPFITIVLVATVTVKIVFALRWSKDAIAPADERESIAIQRAGNLSGYVAKASLICSVVSYIVFIDDKLLFMCAICGIILTYLAKYAFLIIMFRSEI